MRYGGPRAGQLLRLNSSSAQSRSTTQPRCIFRPTNGYIQPILCQRWSSQASKPAGHGQTQAPQPAEVIPAASPTLPTRNWSTPLAKTIAQAIEVTGPIPIASYMRQCLTNPDGGYYTTTREDADQFGTAGDFITSPEISQMFGELVGVWFMTEWMGQGRPTQGVQFIEMGPGRGTLMSDILRTVGQFKTFAKSIQAVWLVEAGEGLRIKQKDLLCGTDAEMKEVADHTGKNRWWEATSKQGIPVRWVEDIVLLPGKQESGEQTTPFIIAHEFFDALPIHAFESVAPKQEVAQHQDAESQLLNEAGQRVPKPSLASKLPQWRELLVAPTRPKFSLATPAELARTSAKEPDPDFQLTLAQASTPSSLVIPERPRYRALKNQVSSRVEVSPESSRYVQEFARRIGGGIPTKTPAGAALIIDYGPLETVPIDSLRAIRKHKVISPFVYAGEADISADVDFVALADAAVQASPGVEVHGPVEQGAWLSQLGIQERAERLLRGLEKKGGNDMDELQKKKTELETGWKRLVEGGPRGMGKAYKVMTILPENGGRRRPVGFGGGVVG